jgi:hypothetical protein
MINWSGKRVQIRDEHEKSFINRQILQIISHGLEGS